MNLSYFLSKAQRLLKILLLKFFLAHPLRSSFFLKRRQMCIRDRLYISPNDSVRKSSVRICPFSAAS
mgnify:CR=1 FL=1